MRDREVILELLRQVARRLWAVRALQEAAFGVCVILFTLVAFQLVQPVLAAVAASGVAIPVVGSGLLIFCGYVLLRIARRGTLAQAAGAADANARLRDELKSAYWFLSRDEDSPFALMQLSRAALTAQRLSANIVVPSRAPRSLGLAIALAGLLALVSWSVPRMSHSLEAAAGVPGEDQGAQPAGLRELLADVPPEPEVKRLDQALAKLEERDASTEDLRRAAAQARDAIDEMNLRAAAAREDLAKLAGAVQGRPGLDGLAEALKQGRTHEAMEMLAQLKNKAGNEGRSGQDDMPLLERAAEGARSESDFAPDNSVCASCRRLGE